MSRLLLAERAEEVSDLLARGLGEDARWAALAPSAMYALESRAIPYVIPEDFLSREDQRRLLLPGHHALEAFCRERDTAFWSRCPALGQAGLRPWLFHFVPLVLPFDALASRALQIKALLDAHPGAEVVCHRVPPQPWGAFGLGFSNDENLFGSLLGLEGWDRRAVLLEASGAAAPATASGWLKRLAGRNLLAASLLKHLSARDLAGAASLLKPGLPGLLILNDPHDWGAAAGTLRRAGYALYRLSDAMVERPPRDEGLSPPDLPPTHPFRAAGVDFSSLLASRLAWVEHFGIPEAERLAALAARLAQRGRLKAALVSTTAGFTGHCLQQGLRAAGVPVVKWQHGFTVAQERIPQFYNFRDLMAVDLLLLFGEGSRAAYEKGLEGFPTRLACVGSAELDRMRPKAPTSPGKRLLYVTTNYNLNYSYCGYDPFFCDRLFYRDQRALLDGLKRLVGEVPGASAAVKIANERAADRPPWTAETGPLAVLDSPGFGALLEDHDAAVIDSPTTTALQAAASGKPLFVLTRHFRYPEDAAAALTRRAVCADSPTALLDAIAAWWGTGSYPADAGDASFLKGWGNHRDDGNSAQRAAEELARAVAIAKMGAA